MKRSLLLSALLAGTLLPAGNNASSDTASFATDVAPVLKERCATCHLTGQEPGKMALHPGAAYGNLVNISSVDVPDMTRVEPGAPQKSYLIHKLEGTHLNVGGSGTRMPLGGPPLDTGTLQLFRAWISSGAINN